MRILSRRSRHSIFLLLCFSCLAGPIALAPAQDTEHIKLFEMKSELLTAFWGREMKIQAGVVVPPGGEPLPVCYNIHGFGGSHRVAWRRGNDLLEKIEAGEYPRMVYVYLNAQFPLGHHEFADSVNNGPWGEALTTEFIPALESEFGAGGRAEARFLTGHSSGGWSSLWLQVTYPDFFGGTWSTSPDPVDFRDFIGADIYAFENFYTDAEGKSIPFLRRGAEYSTTVGAFCKEEAEQREYGGQMASFDAVFSPRAEDGRPMKLFDRETGEIDRDVAEAWKRYDISLLLRENWDRLGPKLAGKLHVFCGTLDTFSLEGAAYLLREELAELGSDGAVIFIEGRGHSIHAPEKDLWPDGLMSRIHREMRASFDRSSPSE